MHEQILQQLTQAFFSFKSLICDSFQLFLEGRYRVPVNPNPYGTGILIGFR
jgi:hypothetical protein